MQELFPVQPVEEQNGRKNDAQKAQTLRDSSDIVLRRPQCYNSPLRC